MLLEVKNLSVRFRNGEEVVRAVDGISFEIENNEVVGLVGESGSGKTVTALSVMKLLPEKASSLTGEIKFFRDGKNGIDILTADEKKIRAIRGQGIAMIFQEPFTALNPVFTIGNQIEEAIFAHRDVSAKDAKLEAIRLLETVRMSDPERVYGSYPHLLSGGERQRAMIAMAVVLKPKLLIADEPTTSLDVTIQSGILDLLLLLKKELNMSILFITHDFGIIKKVADRVLVLKNGKIVEKGKKDVVLSSPENEYTKRLLKAVPKIILKNGKKEKKDTNVIMAVRNLNKTFLVRKGLFKQGKDRVEALKDISLDIREGRTLGIVGESGSGKTTLGKILIGLLKPDSGEIRRESKRQTSIQAVFQDPYNSLDPRMRMRDIVLEGPLLNGVRGGRREFMLKDMLSKVHLDYGDRFKYPHQFSGGQRQRIAIARSLAVNPGILILDEPVSSLDVIIQSEILELLKNIQKELSLTYVFISHDLRIVEYMADDIVVMRKGEIVERAAQDEIFTSPKHPYTKNLLSCILTL